MKRIWGISLLIAVACEAMAVVATTEPVLRKLPNGKTEWVRLVGDENRNYLTTLSGEMIEGTLVDASLAFSLADEAMAGAGIDYSVAVAGMDYSAAGVRKAPSAAALTSYMPSSGKVKIPVVLVSFTDVAFTMTNAKANFDDLYNGNGGTNPYATGSVKDYYSASSNGALDIEYVVFGPYKVSNTMAYYGGNTSSSSSKNARELVVEAARLAVNNGADFSQFDANGDGYVDNISIIYAGYNEAEGGPEESIWPHYSEVGSNETFSGKKLRGYLMTSEYRSSGGSIQCGIGTYCHEFGHALGLPDLYNTNDKTAYTVGYWDIMCSGSYNNNGCTPPTFTAFERFAMGWLKPEQLTQPNNYILEPIETSNKAYLIADAPFSGTALSSSPQEYFLLENRQAVGWDAGSFALVGTGMMISHITFNSSNWGANRFNNSTPLGFDIVEATILNPTASTASDLFPGTGKVTSFIPTLNNGTKLSDQQLMAITEQVGAAVTFHYGVTADEGFFFTPASAERLTTTYETSPVEYDTLRLTVEVKDVTADSILVAVNNSYFQFSLDEGKTWYGTKGAAFPRKSASYTFPLLVRHSPSRQSCDTKTGFLTIQSSDGVHVNQFQLSGWAPRPTYITVPKVYGAQDIATTSFTAEWEDQDDAEYYYVTLYTIRDNHSVDQQTFDSWSSSVDMENDGWSASSYQLTTNVSKSGKAFYFTESGQTLMTKTYVAPPSELDFWLSNNYVSSDEPQIGGQIVVEASTGDGKWTKLETIRVQRTTKNLSKLLTLDPTDEYVCFRFTYTHLGGTGGTAIDEISAALDKEVNYLFSGTDREIVAPTHRAIFSNLTPGTTYYYSVCAYEEWGCEPHMTALSEAQEVTTLTSGKQNFFLTVIRKDDGTYWIRSPHAAGLTTSLCIYTADGRLVSTTRMAYGETMMQIPTDGMNSNELYLLKLIVDDKMRRREAKGKLLYMGD